jgi:hypothetical protein
MMKLLNLFDDDIVVTDAASTSAFTDDSSYWWPGGRLWCKHDYGLPTGDGDRAYVECVKCGKQSPGIHMPDTLKRDATPRVVPRFESRPKPTTTTPPDRLVTVPLDRDQWAGDYLQRREFGQYAGCAFALSPKLDWAIVTDDLGVRVLVPTKRG